MTKKLKRAIYIGIGGTGMSTVLEVRNYFKSLTKDGSLPPMIKCLFIDTNQNDIHKLDPSIQDDEILSLAERYANQIYDARQEEFVTYPNLHNIRIIRDGAAQTRSHGRFAVMCKENKKGNTNQSFSDKFSKIHKDIRDIHAQDQNPEFEKLGDDVTIHLAFSTSGGTGAGSFLSIAYLIRKIVPDCKIIAYAYSHRFFMNLPVREKIQQNTYASLIELDYCMSSDKKEYQDVKYPADDKINRAPFDAVMYIDNTTYSYDIDNDSYVFMTDKKDQVISRVALAMSVSAGELGAEGASIFDNLIKNISDGNHDVAFSKSEEIKHGWIASLGISAIEVQPTVEQMFFAQNLTLKSLHKLMDGSTTISSAADTAFEWIEKLRLNESGNESDKNDVLNRILSADKFNRQNASEITSNNIEGGRDRFKTRANEHLTDRELNSNADILISETKQTLSEVVHNAIFQQNSMGVKNVLSVLSCFDGYLKEYKSLLEEEKESFANEKGNIEEQINEEVELLKHIKKTKFIFDKDEKITASVNKIRSLALKSFVNDVEIRRREIAAETFLTISEYTNNIIDKIDKIRVRIDDAINKVEEKKTKANAKPIYSKDVWGIIDLTAKARKLTTTNVQSERLDDMSDYLRAIGFSSISDLSECDDLMERTDAYARAKFKSEDLEATIVRVIKELTDEERDNYLKMADTYSTPLMRVNDYGERITVNEHVYVAIPEGVHGDNRIKDVISEKFGKRVDVDFVNINDPNKIIIFRQLWAIPPYFIDGISKGRNGGNHYQSCEEIFIEKDRPDTYNPFTDTQFDDIYHLKGFSLSTNKGNNEKITNWVKAFVLGLVFQDKKGVYRAFSETGTADSEDDECRKIRDLGENRVEAFETFCSDMKLYRELTTKIATSLNNKDNEQVWEGYRGNNRKKYRDKFININLEEYNDPDVKKQCDAELSAL